MDFRVDLEIFRGPLDLLLYLVRKHEVEISEIPIAPITDQYLEYLRVLEQMDFAAVGDFVAMAATLLEIKSQMVLPRADEVQDEIDDPRHELVQRLLEYKKYRDAASALEQRSLQWQQHFARSVDDVPQIPHDPAEEPIQEVELWDLVSALGRILREQEAARPSNIVYDETPIHVYMERIRHRLEEKGVLRFQTLFEPGMHKSAVIGMFLAVLELVKHRQVRLAQSQNFAEIELRTGPEAARPLDLSQVDNYDNRPGRD